jgi:dephospho-CoA kinase
VIVFGLTGGIGSGKSTVAALLAKRGAVVLDADEMAREVVEPGTDGLARVLERFGGQLLQPDGHLDRAALANVVFSDPAALADLNAIVHPAVGRLMTERLSEQTQTDHIVVLDIPLLAESGGRERYNLAGVLVIDTPEETAIERVVASRPISRRDAENRIAAQATRTERLREADYVIVNIGTLDELSLMVDRAWEWMQTLAATTVQNNAATAHDGHGNGSSGH